MTTPDKMAQVLPLYQDPNPVWKIVDADRYKFYQENNGDVFYYDFYTNKDGKEVRFEHPVNKTKTELLQTKPTRTCCEFCEDEVDSRDVVVIGWDGCMGGVLNAPTCKECYNQQGDENADVVFVEPNGKIQEVKLVPATATLKATGEKVFVGFKFE